MTDRPCPLTGPHCMICGTDVEDCRRPNDGYSTCCNKRIVSPESCYTSEHHDLPDPKDTP